MLNTIKNGKLYGSNYSFDLPKGFNRVEGLHFIKDDDLVFVSTDNENVQIAIYFETECHSAKDDTQKLFDDNPSLIKMSNYVSVKRGQGVGIGILCENKFGATQHYYERYDFEKNEYGVTQLFIDIIMCATRRVYIPTIQEVLELPTVKAFLESIEYY